MKLPTIPFFKKETKENFILVLLFKKEVVRAILLQEIDSSIQIVATKEEKIEVESAATEDLIVASDKAVSSIELSVPEGKNLKNVIFSVPYFWIEEGKVKKEQLERLKKISFELALKPMGFVVSIEAIIAFLKSKEGVPVTAIFVEESSDFITIYLSRANNILEVKKGSIEEDDPEVVVETLLKGVDKFEVLPSKIVLLHTDGIEKVQQKFLSHHWTKELPFLHLPQVSVLEKGFENEAVVGGVAGQMGLHVMHDIKISKAEEIETDAPQILTSTSNFGFLKERDVAVLESKVEKIESNVEKVSKDEIFAPKDELSLPEAKIDDFSEEKGQEGWRIVSSVLSLIKIPSFGFPNLRLPKIGALVIPIVAGALAIFFVVIYYSFILKAEVILFTDKKEFNDNVKIILSEGGETSFEKKVLSITTLIEELSGEESAQTTGESATGDKAEGEITIFNKTENEVIVAKGSVVTSSNGLEFSLADEIKIASTSSFSTEFSNKKVKLNAEEFGKEYNLPSSTNFTLEGIKTSDLFGKNDVAFSGGTKDIMQVVSSSDLEDLETKLLESLEKDLFNQLPDIEENQEVLPVVLASKFVKKNFSKKEDEEASSVKLSATIEFKLGIYDQDELVKLISESDNFAIPDKYILSKRDSDVDISDISDDDDDLVATLTYKAVFQPEIDTKNLGKEIKSKGSSSARAALNEIEGVSSVKIIMGNIPLLPKLLPFRTNRITIETRVEN